MNNDKIDGPVEILLVEDNPADARLMTEILQESRIEYNLHLVRDGYEAIEFLRQAGDYVGVVRPDLIMLDLNMPRKDGREVLAEIKSDPKIRRIPVIIVTTSQSDEDVITSYDLHANCYINKPMGLKHLYEMAKRIEDFWFGTARLPPREK